MLTATATTSPPAACDLCAQNLHRPCKRCAARRYEATQLHDVGYPIAEIARRLRVTELRVMRLLEQAADRGRMRAVDQPDIPVDVVWRLVDAWHQQDPANHSYLELATRAGYDSTSRVQRLLGLIPTSPVKKGDRIYPGRICTTISPENAGRLLRAMGGLPCDIEGA